MAQGRWTRRQVLIASATGLATAACAGAGSMPTPQPDDDPETPEPPPEWGAATLFTPADSVGKALAADQHAPVPDWFRAAPAFFCPSPRSGGSVQLTFTSGGKYSLPKRISHFRELPDLLDEARSLGTDVLYLIDWYEGAKGEDPNDALWNKGDYVPRADLGGAGALREGLAAVHAKGGRVLSYLELFVIAKSSDIGQQKGQQWSLVTKEGREDGLYPKDWKLCPQAPGMADYMVSTAKRLVGDLGFDGLHLDSYGYQRGWKCVAGHRHAKGDASVFDKGVLNLARRVHEAVRAENDEAVLMCEGPKIPNLFRYVSASQDWNIGDLQTRWLWNQQGVTNAFTAHWSLDDIHQVVALGHKLSLGGGFWHEGPPKGKPSAWLSKRLPLPVKDKKDRRFRRFFIEDYARVLHSWRNAAIVLGLPVPDIDAATPRRWERDGLFDSHEGLKGLAEELHEAAAEVDRAIEGVDDLPAPTDHIRTLCEARAGIQEHLEGSKPELMVQTDSVLAWRFSGPNGPVVTAVNVGNTTETARVEVRKGVTLDELVAGGSISESGGAVELTVPPHSVRVCRPA